MDPLVARLERMEAELLDLRRRLAARPEPPAVGGGFPVRIAQVVAQTGDAVCYSGGVADDSKFRLVACKFLDNDPDSASWRTMTVRSSGHFHAFDPYDSAGYPVGCVVTVFRYHNDWWILNRPAIWKAKVQSGFANYGSAPRYTPATTASVKLLDYQGNVTGDAFDVNLDVPTGFDPYLFADDVIRIAWEANGGQRSGGAMPKPITVTPVHHIKRLCWLGWHTNTNYHTVPRGFQLCDGTGVTDDFAGRFLREAAAATSHGGTGGNDDHGPAGNNHEDHAHDAHSLTTTNVQSGTGTLVVTGVGNHIDHAAHSATDNKPEYIDTHVIIRVS